MLRKYYDEGGGKPPSIEQRGVIRMEARELQKDEELLVEAGVNGNGGYHDMGLRRSHNPTMRIGVETAKRLSKAYLITKRCFDIVFSLGMSIVVLMPMLILALLIVIKDFGNPFYVQERVGQSGKVFWVVKLRSMKKHADELERMLSPEKLEEYHREYKLEDDPRLIGWKKAKDGRRCFGAVLRRTSMDEVPQIIWNILIKGNMSVVGPRPVLHEELMKNYTSEQRDLLLSIKPGLTGYWQAYARNNATYETGERQRMELYYAENSSLWLDVKIIFATIGAVLRKSGAK